MSVVHIDSIHSEDLTNFFDNIGSASFHTVALLQLVRVISLGTFQVENVRVALEYFEVNSLHEEVGVVLTLSVLHVQVALLNSGHVFDLDGLHNVLNDGHEE